MENIRRLLQRLDRLLLSTLKAVSITCFFLLTILITANVFVRFFPVVSLHWFDEIIELLYAYLVFYGAAALWITREHLCVGDWISGRLFKGETALRVYRLVLELLGLLFAAVFCAYATRLTGLSLEVTNVFAIPKKVLYSCMAVSGAIMVLYSIRNCVTEILRWRRPAADARP
jgi:TRAP-type C4-dicarboxylate transport system permease small subunit